MQPNNIQNQFSASPAFSMMDNCKFKIRTMEEAETLATFAADMFKDPERTLPGLYELMANAVEHGCLEIGNDMKTKLLANRSWKTEVTRRQSLPENRKKSVDVVIARRPDGIFVVITDPGKGFDWKSWLALDPARAGETHGRGIACVRSISFDKVTYNPAGNQVAAYSKDLPEMAW
jgi:hypothetical protein